MISEEQIREWRTADYKALGRFLGLAELAGEIPNAQLIEALKNTQAEYAADVKKANQGGA